MLWTFNYVELKRISFEQIINDLYKALITENINNYFHISIEGAHLKVSNFSNEELLNYITDEESPNEYERKERKKSKKKEWSTKNIIHETKDEKEKKIKDEKKNIIEDKKENINIKGDYKLNIVIKETKQNSNKIKAMQSQDIEQKFEKMQKEINELKKSKEESEKYKEENDQYKRKSKMEIDSLNKKISNKEGISSLNQRISDNKVEILRLKSDLQLIKFRSSLKVFVNYMYIGLKLYEDFDYESKISRIISELDSFTSDNSEEYDEKLLSSFQEFMSNFTNKIGLGNLRAHKMNLNKSSWDQIFEMLDKNQKYENVKLFLKNNANVDVIIKELIKNREKNFLNKKLLKDEETKINKKIPDLNHLRVNGKKNKWIYCFIFYLLFLCFEWFYSSIN